MGPQGSPCTVLPVAAFPTSSKRPADVRRGGSAILIPSYPMPGVKKGSSLQMFLLGEGVSGMNDFFVQSRLSLVQLSACFPSHQNTDASM
jgi:hypothetical protein